MNKFLINIVALSIAGSFGACSESFLDTESKTQSSTGNFYKTVDDAYTALIGCYDGWQYIGSNPGIAFPVASEVMSDICFGGTGNADNRKYQVLDRFDISESSSDNNLFETEWSNYYSGIYRCNALIMNEDNIDWQGDTITKGTYMGECRGIRAILYFDAVRLWENIPLITEPTDANVPQAAASEVYAQIVEDLKYGIKNIPADAYPKASSSTNDGRITKYACEALLARVYLFYTGYYGQELPGTTKAEVLAGLEDIIASGEYDLEDNFADLWPAASLKSAANDYVWEGTYKGKYATKSGFVGEISKEIILNQKFNCTQTYGTEAEPGNGDGNCWLVMLGIRNKGMSPYGNGWGACTVNPKFVSEFESGDVRKTASIIDLEGEGVTGVDGFTKKSINDQREYTGYTNKKYTPLAFYDGKQEVEALNLGEKLFQVSQYQDYTVMRYADVLLMAAELGSANAQVYFDKVRDRAGLGASKKAATKDNIIEERKFEFCFEGLRYWDLLRQGSDKAAQVIVDAQNGVKVLSGGLEETVTTTLGNINNKRGLCQIPQNQITLSNNVLKQNDGWK